MRVVFVGGGPRTTGILLRLAAAVTEAGANAPTLDIHVVDPYPAGGGRIWRRDQSPLLWMNSEAQDVTIYADESVEMDGPVVPGPTLEEFVVRAGQAEDTKANGKVFASRRVMSAYLEEAFHRAERDLARAGSRVTVHRAEAVDATGAGSDQAVELSDGSRLTDIDYLVLCLGHVDVESEAGPQSLAAQARARGLTYVAPGFTADIDLSVVAPGEPAIVRGFGLAFIDAMVLLTEERGGRYVADPGAPGGLAYEPSGREPILWVGSGRGTTHLPKLTYSYEGELPKARYLDAESLHAVRGDRALDYHADVVPLIEWNLRYAFDRHLFEAHPERVTVPWEVHEKQLATLLPRSLGGQGAAELDADYLERAFPDPAHRWDFAGLVDPLDRDFADRAEVEGAVEETIANRLERVFDSANSEDAAVLSMILQIYVRAYELEAAGEFTSPQNRESLRRHLFRLFSYVASGPPPQRVAQLLALHRAGIVRFLGPRLRVSVGAAGFEASSPRVGEPPVVASTLVDAFLADASPRRAAAPLLQRLLSRGELTVTKPHEVSFAVDAHGHPIPEAPAAPDQQRFLLGPLVVGGGAETPFARPGVNALGFRKADAVAREILGRGGALLGASIRGGARVAGGGQ
ncbi:FAD/NAD(P)-binding protein [Corynebacterium timonense]|uniref:FAD-NAD(P)-binding n=1 Tax=Corynebacterium timonense TaxID=441500 RepID=A0A1H1M365_9CORY|nr:FAD/NAD(P)-binding protein [Corynebacterium timonense]SDR81243.1 FAD-NAD(P)-binding [Corynebacterium timonense]